MKKTTTIEKVEHVRTEKVKTHGANKSLYYYFLFLKGFDEPIFLDGIEEKLNEEDLISNKVELILNKEGNITKFTFV